MDEYNAYFPYPQYRPHQTEMLSFAYDIAKKGGIGLINAPTGSGKTSIISAVLAAIKDNPRPIIVACRMVSQIEIYTRELELIRSQKKPDLKYAYIIGKNKSCKRFDENEKALLNRCRKLCKNTRQNILHSKNPEFERLEDCSWYANSIMLSDLSEKFEPSLELCDKILQFVTTHIDETEIKKISEPCCPYELMKHATNYSDVIVCNYHHLLNPIVRKILFSNFFDPTQIGKIKIAPKSPIVIFDEAHNLPDAINSMFSVSINKASVDGVIELIDGTKPLLSTKREQKSTSESDFTLQLHSFFESPNVRPYVLNEKFSISSIIQFIRGILASLSEFISKSNKKFKDDEIFDPAVLITGLSHGNDTITIPELRRKILVIQQLLELFSPQNDEIIEIDLGDGDIQSINSIWSFVSTLLEHSENPAVIKCFLKKKTDEKENDPQLKLKFIDPESMMQAIASKSHAVLLMSGTLQPPEAYGQILFGSQQEIKMLTLPNSFSRENRKLVIANDCTTLSRVVNAKKKENRNNFRIAQYLKDFVKIPGNIAIFCSSYEMTRKCQKILEEDKVPNIFLQPQGNEATLELKNKFMSLPEHGERGILIAVSGGRLSEGIDYVGNLLVGVMVIGLPLARYDIFERSKMQYYQYKFGPESGEFLSYTLPAINKSLQAIGRVIRSEKDRGIMVLCDKRFLDTKNFNNLPQWMQEEFLETNITHFHKKCSIPI
jgi:DNA excision repair protein ERCC-2